MPTLIKQNEPLPDAQLIDGILAGNKNLFEIIIRRYNQRLFRIGVSILNSEAEAEDAMQNAYLKAYEHLRSFENRATFATWLTRIMINECLGQKNKHRHIQSMNPLSENATTMRTPAHILMNKELSGLLENAIGQLPDKYRLVFVLRELEEMSVKETGDALAIAESNVKVRLNRARTMLKNNLNGYLKENVYAFHLSRCDKIVQNVMALIQ